MTAPEPPARLAPGGLLPLLLAGLLLGGGGGAPPAAAVPTDRADAVAPREEWAGPVGAGTTEAVRARLAEARERLHQLRVGRDLSAARLAATEAEVAGLRAAWRASGAALRWQRGEVGALDRRLGALAVRRGAAEHEARRRREVAGRALGALALEGRSEERADPRAAGRLRAIGATLLAAWRSSEARVEALGRRREVLAARRAEAAAGLDAALARADGLRDRLAERSRRHRSARASVREAARGVEAAAAEVESLLAELDRAGSPGGPAPAGVAGGGAPGPVMPAAGRVVVRFGEAAAGPRDHGIVIGAVPGQTVDAPAAGRVAFAGSFRSYGLLLIIDHGDGYHSLLSGMSRLHVGVKQWVRAGEPVASFDDLGEIGPQLYVELRRNGRPVNPLSWLAASDSKVRG